MNNSKRIEALHKTFTWPFIGWLVAAGVFSYGIQGLGIWMQSQGLIGETARTIGIFMGGFISLFAYVATYVLYKQKRAEVTA